MIWWEGGWGGGVAGRGGEHKKTTTMNYKKRYYGWGELTQEEKDNRDLQKKIYIMCLSSFLCMCVWVCGVSLRAGVYV